MKKRLFITLIIAAAISCTACGKDRTARTDVPSSAPISTTAATSESVTTTAKTTAVKTTTKAVTKATAVPTTTVTAKIVTTARNEGPVYNTTTKAAAPVTQTATTTMAVQTTNVTTTAVPLTTAAPVPVTTQPPQPQRPAGTPPSPQDSDYAPAPTQYNIEGITYIQGALIANKSYSLPASFNPGLDPTCQAQFNKMVADSSKQGLKITFGSGFRSYNDQYTIYNNYVARDGQAAADTYSARAGYSEHQSGLAIDVNSISHYFDGTPEAVWLENHCHEYGFILRYPQGKESITGYQYESWHLRYLGTDLSYAVHDSGLTLEEYFGIDSYYH